MNGKGDKWRGGWSKQFANNHNKIFGEKMKDVRGTKLNIGDNKKAIKMLNWKIKKSSLDAAKDIFKLKL